MYGERERETNNRQMYNDSWRENEIEYLDIKYIILLFIQTKITHFAYTRHKSEAHTKIRERLVTELVLNYIYMLHDTETKIIVIFR